MKKLLLLIIALLCMPFIASAKEIEIVSIETSNDYKDVEVSLEDSKTAVINFTVNKRNFISETAYKLVIKNNTDKSYDLNLEYLNTDSMTVTTDKNKLSPGENNVTLVINREETDITFAGHSETSSDVNLLLNTKEKENPNTGNTIIMSLVVTAVLVAGAIILYNKTNKASAFYILLLLLIVPGIIIAAEENTIKIKINTIIDNTYKIALCNRKGTQKEIFTFDYLDFIQPSDNIDIIAYLSGLDPEEIEITDVEFNKEAFYTAIEEAENVYIFNKSTILEKISEIDPATFGPEELEEDELIYNFMYSLVSNGFVEIYEETDNTLIITLILNGPKKFGYSTRAYEVSSARIILDKESNDYIVEVYNNYAKTSAYAKGTDEISQVVNMIYNALEGKNYIPLIHIDAYVENVKENYPKMTMRWNASSGIDYTIDGQTYNETTIRRHLTSDLYYVEFEYDEYDPDKFVYYMPAAKTFDSEIRNTNLFHSDTYRSRINAIELFSPTYEEIEVNPNIGNHYAVLIPPEDACYRMPIYE